MSKKDRPAWFYGPDGEARIFEEGEDPPAGWKDHQPKAEDEGTPPAEPSLLDGNAETVIEALPSLSDDELAGLKADETAGKSRKGVLAAIDEEIERRAGEE